MIKVLVADDHKIFRAGVKRLIEESPDIEVAGEAHDGFDAMAKLRQQEWDVVLLDINMPNKSGLDIVRQMKLEKPKLPILILSMYPEEQYAVRALKAGAAGYLTKDSESEELIAAIRKVVKGGRYATPALLEKLLFELDGERDAPKHHALSEREHQIFEQIIQGKSLTEIAEAMSISVKTVSTYRTRVLEKMNMENNAELIHYAIQHGLSD
ncbi:MAG TPA: DNA-binding response regulator [Oxalobacteraceae bacterium]|nr:DNA-binding response regulator [Oxalobacteraceae bacterium]